MSIKLMARVWDLALDQGSAWVLMALADCADDEGDHCFPSVPWLAWKTGYSERQVRRILRRLEEAGLIYATGAKLGGRGLPTLYQLQLEKGVKKSPFVREGDRETRTYPADIRPETRTASAEKADITVSPDPRLQIQEGSPPVNPDGLTSSPAGEERDEPGFEERPPPWALATKGCPKGRLAWRWWAEFDGWWLAYPRRKRLDKPEAWQAWCKAKPTEEEMTTIHGALREQICSRDWRHHDGEFIPLPATWLNGRRWER